MDDRRFQLENYYLNKRFPRRFVFMDMGTLNAWLDCSVKTNTGLHYRLKITLEEYPDEMPSVYVIHPHPMRGYGGQNMADIGPSADLHLLSPDDEGNIQICHYKEPDWVTGNQLLSHVMLHAKMWLEAYEQHKKTGEPLDKYLKH